MNVMKKWHPLYSHRVQYVNELMQKTFPPKKIIQFQFSLNISFEKNKRMYFFNLCARIYKT